MFLIRTGKLTKVAEDSSLGPNDDTNALHGNECRPYFFHCFTCT